MSIKVVGVIVDPGVEPDVAEVTATLATYKKIVGGQLQFLLTDDETMIAYIDEEAKLKPGVVRNEVGSEMYTRVSQGLLPGDYIAGPIFFIGMDDDGLECSLTQEQIVRLKDTLEL